MPSLRKATMGDKTGAQCVAGDRRDSCRWDADGIRGRVRRGQRWRRYPSQGVCKSYADTPVLRGGSLAVAPGSPTAILGASGAGKTTLLRIIAGFEPADAGTIELGGQVVDGGQSRAGVPPERRHIGFVPQDGALFPHLTVHGNVAFGLPRSARRGPFADELLELVGLSALGGRYPHELSGGQQQRVAIARALASRTIRTRRCRLPITWRY